MRKKGNKNKFEANDIWNRNSKCSLQDLWEWLIYGNDWFVIVLKISSLNWFFIKIRLFAWSNANKFYTLLFLCYIFTFVKNEALIDRKIEINFSWYEKIKSSVQVG